MKAVGMLIPTRCFILYLFSAFLVDFGALPQPPSISGHLDSEETRTAGASYLDKPN